MGGSGRDLILRAFSGPLQIQNLTGDNYCCLDFVSGYINIDTTVSAGELDIRGIVRITDNSTGTAVVNTSGAVTTELTADAVWEEAVTDHSSVSGSFAEAIKLISDIEGGRWKIESNQMIFYEDDNITEVARFNLYDSGGSPAMEDVFERTRV
jgi:hypothetical protein